MKQIYHFKNSNGSLLAFIPMLNIVLHMSLTYRFDREWFRNVASIADQCFSNLIR